jgi:HEAT repeat protein
MARFLIVAYQTAATEALAQGLKAHTAEAPTSEFVLLVPATPPKHLLVLREGDAEEIARLHMEAARDYLEAAGLNIVRSAVGAASPLVAIDEELRGHGGEYDGIFISTFPSNISRWLRMRLPTRVQHRFGLPVIHIVGRLEKPADSSLKWVEEHLSLVERGDVSPLQLPLENISFWTAILRLAAGRPQVDLVPTARQLLLQVVADPASKARVTAAIEALTSEKPSVRRVAIKLLAGVSEPSVEAVARQALGDTDPQVRMGAIRVLEQQRTQSAVAALTDVLTRASDPRAPLAADALVRLGEFALPGLRELLNSRSSHLRWIASHCIARMQNREALPALLKAFYDESPPVAWAAADGLAALGPSVCVDVVKSILRSGEAQPPAVALRHYAEHAAPRRAFRPLLDATTMGRERSLLSVAAAETLKALEESRTGRLSAL